MDHLALSRLIKNKEYENIKVEIQIYRSDGEDMDDFLDRGVMIFEDLLDKMVKSVDNTILLKVDRKE